MTAGARRPRSDGAKNRRLLIESARVVFAELGINAPLDVVARRAGVGNATLYRHFPSREDLVVETFRLDLTRHMDVIQDARTDSSPWDGFLRWLRFCFHEQLTDIGLSQTLGSVRRGLDADVDRLRESTIDGIRTLIEGAKVEGLFREDRWLEDVLLHLEGHFQLVRERTEGAAAASARWLELTLDAISVQQPAQPHSAEVPASVIAVRAAYRDRLRGDGDTTEKLVAGS